MSLACRYVISPSGFPPLQVINAEGIVSVIVFAVILLNTKLSPVVGPNSIKLGRLYVVAAKHSSKQPYPAVVNAGKLNVVADEQF